jgi:superfamily II DNA or RNA helicase
MNQNQNNTGTIYLRDNAWYRMENVIKMGIASFAKDRSSTYITGEVERGEYITVIEIPLVKMKYIDNLLKYHFTPLHVYKGGGTEFYDRSVIHLLEPYLQSLQIDYKVLSKPEMDTMERCIRLKTLKNINNIKKEFQKLSVQKIKKYYKNKKTDAKTDAEMSNENENVTVIQPTPHQQSILDMIQGFYQSNSIGKLVWACGLGKALISILITQKLGFHTIVFGVPSNHLQKQIKKEILKIFPNKNNLLFIGGDDENMTHSKEEIKSFLCDGLGPRFVITTYHSCYLLAGPDIAVDFKIGDEAHHLVGIEKEEEKGFRLFHKINSKKTLFMTATEKTLETRSQYNKYSMDDESIFGKYIDMKSVCWAIENKKITDYQILVLKNTEDEVDQIINHLKIRVCNKDLFISAYMCLKSFEKYNDLTHLLLYTNTTEDAQLAKTYIDDILELNILSSNILSSKKDIYNNALHSKNGNGKEFEREVERFKNASRGIISCVYIFGEGFDLPKLNGVCIGGNMQSETRIVQYLLRPNRLERGNPTKRAYVIIPYIDMYDEWNSENKSYEKVRTIVSQMRNVDENIEQKIRLSIAKKRIGDPRNLRVFSCEGDYDYDFEENGDELNKIKLRLRYSKALGSNCSEEEDEYNYVRSINFNLGVQSPEEYNQARTNHVHFIENPETYFKAKGVWRNWYDFIGMNTSRLISTKQEWVRLCKENKVESLDQYFELCNIDERFPKYPAGFYIDFTNIPSELGFYKNRRR